MNADPALRRKWFELWDAKNYLQYAAGSCPVLWCDGTNDRWYTLEMLKRSCDLLGPSVPLTLSIKLRMPHGHPPYGDPKEITACADHYLKGGPRPAKIESAHVDGSRFVADFSEGGMKVVGAEFLWTCATNVVLRDREWLSRPADEFDAAGGRCAAALPQGVVMFLMSLTTADGLKFSTGPFGREDVSRDCGARHSCGIIGKNR